MAGGIPVATSVESPDFLTMIHSWTENVRHMARWLGLLEKWLIVALVGFMVGFALLQIILRNFFSTGIVWGDTLLRHLMLWVSILGAARATAERRHICIEILPMVLPARTVHFLSLLTSLVPAIACAVLAWVSLRFVQNEQVPSNVAFANVPAWWTELIFPLGFAVMAIRFGAHLIEDLSAGPNKEGKR